MKTKQVVLLMLALVLVLAGCNPVVLAAKETYDVAADPRSVATQAGRAAVDIARQTSGVKRVETFFVSRRPSWENDIETKEKIRALLIADPVLVSGRVDIGVYAGHVVLVGVATSQANVQRFISDARSVSGVRSVMSYIQTV